MSKRYECWICNETLNRSYFQKYEKTQLHQNNIKKTMICVLNFLYFECNKGKERINVNELLGILFNNSSEILDITEENKYSAWEIRAPTADMHNGKGGDSISYRIPEFECKCSIKHDIDLYMEFLFSVPNIFSVAQVFYIDEIEKIIPLKSKTFRLGSDSYMLEGRVILNLLHWMFERWAAISYSIEIVSPFVDKIILLISQ